MVSVARVKLFTTFSEEVRCSLPSQLKLKALRHLSTINNFSLMSADVMRQNE